MKNISSFSNIGDYVKYLYSQTWNKMQAKKMKLPKNIYSKLLSQIEMTKDKLKEISNMKNARRM